MMASGVPSVMTSGMTRMLKWSAGSWDSGNFPVVRHRVVIEVGRTKNMKTYPFTIVPALPMRGIQKPWVR